MPNPKIFYLMQRAHSALFRASDRFLKAEVGLSSSQHAVLLVLMKNDGLSISRIADALDMRKSSLTGLIDRMSAKGLVRRSENGFDGRSYDIFLLEQGRRIAEATLFDTRRMNSALLEPFSVEERETIESFLLHVARNADEIVTAKASQSNKEREVS